MRFSPTRIVLAALAFIVGAVLALPMLLSRKAEAGDALPKLEAEAGAAWVLAAGSIAQASVGQAAGAQDSGTPAHLGGTAAGRVCGDGPDSDGMAALCLAVAGPDQPPLGLSPTPAGLLPSRIDRISYKLASPPAAPWPDPQALDRQRKYHMRP